MDTSTPAQDLDGFDFVAGRFARALEEEKSGLDGWEMAEALWLGAQWLRGVDLSAVQAEEPAGRGEAEAGEGTNPAGEPVVSSEPLQDRKSGSQTSNSKATTAEPKEPVKTEPSKPRPVERQHRPETAARISVPGLAEGTGVGLPIKIPAAQALPGTLDISRALRPLRRRVTDAHRAEWDWDKTVRQIAETDIWIPATRPVKDRALHLALICDAGSTMVPWLETMEEWRRFMELFGAFQSVRSWWVDSGPPQEGAQDQLPLLRARRDDESMLRSWDEHASADGRLLMLVLSDCVGRAWRDGRMTRALEACGHRASVAIVQMLPPSMWDNTPLAAGPEVRVTSAESAVVNIGLSYATSDGVRFSNVIQPRPLSMVSGVSKNGGGTLPCNEAQIAKVNRQLKSVAADPYWRRELARDESPRRVPIPVLPLLPAWLNEWSRMVAGDNTVTIQGVYLPTADEVKEWDEAARDLAGEVRSRQKTAPAARELSQAEEAALERVRQFRANASELAQKLAAYMTAAPLSLPVIRLLQSVYLPESRQIHLAEVLLGGVLVELDAETAAKTGEQYAFQPMVGEELATNVPIPDAMEIVRTLTDRVLSEFGAVDDFDAVVEAPERLRKWSRNEAGRPFALATARVLRRLGGVYAEAAQSVLGGGWEEPEGEQMPPGVRQIEIDASGTSNAPIYKISWSSDGKRLAAPRRDSTCEIWDFTPQTSSLRLSTRLQVARGGVNEAAWYGDFLGTASYDKVVHIFSGINGGLVFEAEAAKSDIRAIVGLERVGELPSGLSFVSGLPTRRVPMFAAGSQGGTLRITHSDRSVDRYRIGAPIAALSFDGVNLIAVGLEDCRVVIWNLHTYEVDTEVTVDSSIKGLCWSPDGRELFFGTFDGDIYRWRENAGAPVPLSKLHQRAVTSLSISYDGRLLASKSNDGTVRIWRCVDGALLGTIPEPTGENTTYGLAFHPSKALLVTQDRKDTQLRLWEFDTPQTLDADYADRPEDKRAKAEPGLAPVGRRVALLVNYFVLANGRFRGLDGLQRALEQFGYLSIQCDPNTFVREVDLALQELRPRDVLWLHIVAVPSVRQEIEDLLKYLSQRERCPRLIVTVDGLVDIGFQANGFRSEDRNSWPLELPKRPNREPLGYMMQGWSERHHGGFTLLLEEALGALQLRRNVGLGVDIRVLRVYLSTGMPSLAHVMMQGEPSLLDLPLCELDTNERAVKKSILVVDQLVAASQLRRYFEVFGFSVAPCLTIEQVRILAPVGIELVVARRERNVVEPLRSEGFKALHVAGEFEQGAAITRWEPEMARQDRITTGLALIEAVMEELQLNDPPLSNETFRKQFVWRAIGKRFSDTEWAWRGNAEFAQQSVVLESTLAEMFATSALAVPPNSSILAVENMLSRNLAQRSRAVWRGVFMHPRAQQFGDLWVWPQYESDEMHIQAESDEYGYLQSLTVHSAQLEQGEVFNRYRSDDNLYKLATDIADNSTWLNCYLDLPVFARERTNPFRDDVTTRPSLTSANHAAADLLYPLFSELQQIPSQPGTLPPREKLDALISTYGDLREQLLKILRSAHDMGFAGQPRALPWSWLRWFLFVDEAGAEHEFRFHPYAFQVRIGRDYYDRPGSYHMLPYLAAACHLGGSLGMDVEAPLQDCPFTMSVLTAAVVQQFPQEEGENADVRRKAIYQAFFGSLLEGSEDKCLRTLYELRGLGLGDTNFCWIRIVGAMEALGVSQVEARMREWLLERSESMSLLDFVREGLAGSTESSSAPF